jgi:replicative DNA helicase
MKRKDENDRLLDGTLPQDPEEGTAPIAGAAPVRAATARLMAKEPPLPSDPHAEAALLAALLWSGVYAPGALTPNSVRDILESSEMFHSAAHRAIWDAIVDVSDKKLSVDQVSVHSSLVRARADAAAGGIAYLDELIASAVATPEAKLRAHAQAIRDTWVRRAMIAAAREIETVARSGETAASDVVMKAQDLVTGISKSASTDSSFVRISNCLADIIKTMGDGRGFGISTGFRDIDDASAGLFRCETTILGARTSVGKSALAVAVAKNVAASSHEGHKLAVMYVTLEMPAQAFTARVISSLSEVDAKKLRRHTVAPGGEEYARVLRAADLIGRLPIYFVGGQRHSMLSIHGAATKLTAKLQREGISLALIVVDHVGLVRPSAASLKSTREQQVAEVSRGLRFLAEQHNCHVMGLAQINRMAELRKPGSMPQLSDLRESGSLEQDADNVWLLHRDFDEKRRPIPGKPAKLALAKQRNDGQAFVLLKCEPQFVRFSDWDGPPESDD